MSTNPYILHGFGPSPYSVKMRALMRYRRRGNMIALEAANPAYETRVFPDHLVKVQGRLVGLIRSY